MERRFGCAPILLTALTVLCLSGCGINGEKSASLSTVYGAIAVLSLLLLTVCCLLARKKSFWLILLFSSVLVVNTGYALLSVSSSLDMALHANRIAYLGSVLLPLSMLMIILNVTRTAYKKWLPWLLLGVSLVVFLIAASPGIIDIYYKEVRLETVNGVSHLVKVYGPLHSLYLFYLLGYFFAMVAVIIRAYLKKSVDSTSHAIVLAMAVLVNIGVWLIEQLSSIEFEMLSVSYIISELFLLGIHLVMRENQKLHSIVEQVKTVREYSEDEVCAADSMLRSTVEADRIDLARLESFTAAIFELTSTERKIYDAYIARVTTKEIMESLNIKENTLKYHNKNLYGKLGVSSRKEILEIHKQLKLVKARLDGK